MSQTSAAARRVAHRRNAEPLFASWLNIALKRAHPFPSLTAPQHSSGNMMTVQDGIHVFNLLEILRLFRLEHPELDEDGMRSLMLPYSDANDALRGYASLVNYVEGWCQLTNVVVGKVTDVPHNTLFILLTRVLEAIPLGQALSANAQIQVWTALSGTAVSLLTALHDCVVKRDVKHQLPVAEAQNILRLLSHALVQYGEHTPAMRHNIYNCFVVFLSFPDIQIDPNIIIRIRDPLFSRLVADGAEGDDRTAQIMAIRTLQRFCSVGDVADSFIGEGQGANGSAGARVSTFVSSVLASLDTCICTALGASSHQEASAAVYLADAVFSFFCRLSMTQALALHHVNAIPLLQQMRCWTPMRHLLLGRAEGSEHMGSLSVIRDVARRVLLSAIRWLSVLTRHLKDHTQAIFSIADFVNFTRGIFSFLLETPFGNNPTSGGSLITTQFLDLLLQTLQLLYGLSCAPCMERHVPDLIELFSLRQLLQTVSHRDLRGARIFVSDEQVGSSGALSGVVGTNLPNVQQKVLLGKCCRTLLMFLLNCTPTTSVESQSIEATRRAARRPRPELLVSAAQAFDHIASGALDQAASVREMYTLAAEACALLIQAELVAIEDYKKVHGNTNDVAGLDPALREQLLAAIESGSVRGLTTDGGARSGAAGLNNDQRIIHREEEDAHNNGWGGQTRGKDRHVDPNSSHASLSFGATNNPAPHQQRPNPIFINLAKLLR